MSPVAAVEMDSNWVLNTRSVIESKWRNTADNILECLLRKIIIPVKNKQHSKWQRH